MIEIKKTFPFLALVAFLSPNCKSELNMGGEQNTATPAIHKAVLSYVDVFEVYENEK